MLDPNLSHGGRTGMTGDAVLPQLQTVGDRWWRTAHLGVAKFRRRNRQPVGFHKKFIGQPGNMTLITEFILRMGRDRCIGILLYVVAAPAMAGDTVLLPRLKRKEKPCGESSAVNRDIDAVRRTN